MYLEDRLLHSAYDPMKEARREIDAIAADNPSIVVVLGMGLGYSIDAALERFPAAKIFVIEADPAIHGFASDVRTLPSDPRITYVLGKNREANFIAITHEIGPAEASSIKYLTRLADLDLPYYTEIVELIGRVAAMHIEGMRTTAHFGLLWWTNSVLNWRQWLTAPDVSGWFGARRGKPVFIFAAGPTMFDGLDIFQSYEGGIRFVVDTAFPPVSNAGIRVDAVFAIDAQRATLDHFKNLLPHRLIGAPVVPPELWAMADERIITSLAGPHFDWFDKALDRRVAKLKSGGSVTTFAFDLARRMGADPIVLIGADFAHRGGRRHVGGTTYESQSLAGLNRFSSVETSRSSNVVHAGFSTEENLIQYAQWMKWEIAETRAAVYRMVDFGLLDETPVIGRGHLEDLLRESKPTLPPMPARRTDEKNLLSAFRKELGTLDRALAGPPQELASLSGFFDPIIRPYAVVSTRETLPDELIEKVRAELRQARNVLYDTVS